jgi:hypothetical protein
VISIVSHAVVLLFDATHIVAYGREGLRWRSQRLSYDGLSGLHVADAKLVGTAFDPTASSNQAPFAVDLADGSHEGGAAL